VARRNWEERRKKNGNLEFSETGWGAAISVKEVGGRYAERERVATGKDVEKLGGIPRWVWASGLGGVKPTIRSCRKVKILLRKQRKMEPHVASRREKDWRGGRGIFQKAKNFSLELKK